MHNVLNLFDRLADKKLRRLQLKINKLADQIVFCIKARIML